MNIADIIICIYVKYIYSDSLFLSLSLISLSVLLFKFCYFIFKFRKCKQKTKSFFFENTICLCKWIHFLLMDYIHIVWPNWYSIGCTVYNRETFWRCRLQSHYFEIDILSCDENWPIYWMFWTATTATEITQNGHSMRLWVLNVVHKSKINKL